MRFFYAPEVSPLHQLDADESKHMVRVLRANTGDEFEIVDGRGRRYKGVLKEANKRCCVLATTLLEEVPAPSAGLTLVIAPTKSTERFEWLLEKAMEYGAHRIQPIWTERSERKVSKDDRWNRILISALKQSKQLWLTELAPAMPWTDWVASENSQRSKGFVAHCEPTDKLHFFDEVPVGAPCWIGIGPEGDFTSVEIEMAQKAGFTPVSLGDQRLRTETAGLAAVQMHQLAQRR
mgnify:CR=1 FL=1